MRSLSICVAAVSTLLICAACDDGGRPARQRGRLQVQESGDGIEILGPDGTILIKGNREEASVIINADEESEAAVSYTQGKLAPNFPSDIPVLPDASVTMNQVFQNGQNAIATLTTNKDPEEVILFFEEQIPLKGWDPGDRFDLDNIVMLNGKRDNASLNISITTKDQSTTINIARTEAPE